MDSLGNGVWEFAILGSSYRASCYFGSIAVALDIWKLPFNLRFYNSEPLLLGIYGYDGNLTKFLGSGCFSFRGISLNNLPATGPTRSQGCLMPYYWDWPLELIARVTMRVYMEVQGRSVK